MNEGSSNKRHDIAEGGKMFIEKNAMTLIAAASELDYTTNRISNKVDQIRDALFGAEPNNGCEKSSSYSLSYIVSETLSTASEVESVLDYILCRLTNN